MTLEPCQMCAALCIGPKFLKVFSVLLDENRGFRKWGTQLHPKQVICGVLEKRGVVIYESFLKISDKFQT